MVFWAFLRIEGTSNVNWTCFETLCAILEFSSRAHTP